MRRLRVALGFAWALGAAGCGHLQAPKPEAVPPPVPAAAEPDTGAPYAGVPATPPGKPRTEWVDVGVLVDADSARVGATAEARVEGVVEIAGLSAGQWILVRSSGGRLLLQPSPGFRELVVYEATETVFVTPLRTNGYLSVNGRNYRGALKVFRSPAGRVTVVNRVAIDDYLRGVLPHEIGKLDEHTIEAGKAQAVAARTYALSYVGRRADQGFDVLATVEDQLYGGTRDEGALTDRCVRETGGLVGTYQGRLIRANYFSTCGGVTANVEDVWPEEPLPWLRSEVDAERDGDTPYCSTSPQFRWTEIWGVPEFLDIVNRSAPKVVGPFPSGEAGRLEDVRVVSRSRSGRVAELAISTDAGSIAVHGDSTRRVLLRPASSKGAGGGGTLLRSSLFKIAVVRDGGGYPLAVVATGAGFGHGVGMCQWGALEMARRGYDFRRILGHYFEVVDLRPTKDLAG